MTILLVLTC